MSVSYMHYKAEDVVDAADQTGAYQKCLLDVRDYFDKVNIRYMSKNIEATEVAVYYLIAGVWVSPPTTCTRIPRMHLRAESTRASWTMLSPTSSHHQTIPNKISFSASVRISSIAPKISRHR